MNPKVHDLYQGYGAETFGALLKQLEAWGKRTKSFSQDSWADQQLVAEMKNWVTNQFDGSRYNYFATFARQFCQFDERPVVKELKDILFPLEFPKGRLIFHEVENCWTLGLDELDQKIAANAFVYARSLVHETLSALLLLDDYNTVLLCKTYFDSKERNPPEHTVVNLIKQFELLKSALDGKTLFVLCKGDPTRSGVRTCAYVDPGLDNCVFPACAQASRCIYLNQGFFKGRETRDEFSISGEGLLFHSMTILHELTHHILKTDDVDEWYYGRKKCFDLAARRPREAMTNADSFALFARDLKLCKTGSKLSFLNGL